MSIARPRDLVLGSALLAAACAAPKPPPRPAAAVIEAPPAVVAIPAPKLSLPKLATRPRPKPRPVAPQPRIDQAGAARMRAAALDAIARGDVLRARSLLRRAAALDPANPLIRRDLARIETAASRTR